MRSLWTGTLDATRALEALVELGDEHQDLVVEYNYDALTLGVGDGALLRTVVVPADTSFRVRTDRYKQGGFRFHAVLPPSERASFKRMCIAHENDRTRPEFWVDYGALHFGEGTILCPAVLNSVQTDTQPIQMLRNLFCSEVHFRVDMDPSHLASLVDRIRPRANNDAVILEWQGREIRLTGLVKALDEESRIQVSPQTVVCRGLGRKKFPWKGATAINLQGTNAVKVDGERLQSALEWLGNDSAFEVYVGTAPLALAIRKKQPVARHALLMMQRFLPEEVEYVRRRAG